MYIKDGKNARARTYQSTLELQHLLGLSDVKAGSVPSSQTLASKGDATPTEKVASKPAEKK
jgi:hypothetical protein